ncbi:hypothetical protein [Streptomyces botrytidirepellens]|uniref:Uncharacterized protein n=1 Tax=Streptomyces botrytidirepellens TaxID=2486417 RepID=A0A3M8WWV1_9ACTN|nr:hypothetical protein [Streptomyces botrytidirepellens]RNG34237.1 hypothetical protein EEJ42_06130 [Streptomyces botrytidirepellens]
MEQRIGPIIPPVPAAGTDPGHIPGLTPPRPDETEEVTAEAKTATEAPEEAPEKAADQPVDEAAEADADAEEADAEAEEPEEQAEDAAEDKAEDAAEADAKADAEPEDGPVFEVSDRRGSITAGHSGVAFQLDGENAEFSWDEIGAVEIDTPRFGRRFSVTVYTTAHRWYAADVDAPARGALKEWTAQLDEVLDAYFEDTAGK